MAICSLEYPVCSLFFRTGGIAAIFAACLTLNSTIMKKSTEIAMHALLWIFFGTIVLTFSKLYLHSNPGAPFEQHLAYVIFLELAMSMLLFYITFFTLDRLTGRKPAALTITGILAAFVIVFALPALSHGFWQIMSSVIPHLFMIFMAVIMKKFASLTRADSSR